MYRTFAWPPDATLRAIWRAIVVLPVPCAPPMSSSSPVRRPVPIVLSRGVKPSGTGWYSATWPDVTLSLRSTRTSRAERGVRLPFAVSSRQADASTALTGVTGVSGASVLTRLVPPGLVRCRQGSTRTGVNHQSEPTKSAQPPRAGRLTGQVDQLVEHPREGPDPRLVVAEVHPLVRGMRVVIGRRDPEQDHRKPEDRGEAGADRDGAALPHVHRRLPECRLQCACRGAGGGVVHRRQARMATADVLNGGRDTWRCDLLDIGPESLEDPVRVLVGDEPAAHLGVSVGRDDRLAPLPHEPTPDAVDVEGRPDRATLQRRVPALADERRQAEAREVLALVERERGEGRPILLRQGGDIVVEARDADPAVGTLQPRDDLREGVGRVLDDAPVATGMEVDLGPDDVDLGVHYPAQAERDRRDVAFEEARVADDRDVSREPVPVRLEPGVEMDGARLLLALEDIADVHRHRTTRREESSCGHDMGVDLALVVGGTAGEEPVADHDRLERRRGPQVERVHGLHVVVAVDDDSRFVIGVEPVRVDHRMATRLRPLDMLEPGFRQRVGDPACGATADLGMS